MKKLINLLYYWFPPLIWMVFIFVFSSRTRISMTHEYVTDFIIFKSLHMIEYATLYFLTFRAFNSLSSSHIKPFSRMLYPLIISFLYAISDEFHQTFISTREGTPRDVIIDSIGIFLMYIYIKRNGKNKK